MPALLQKAEVRIPSRSGNTIDILTPLVVLQIGVCAIETATIF